MKKVLILILVTSILAGIGCSPKKEDIISQNTENVTSSELEDNALQNQEDVSEINKIGNTNGNLKTNNSYINMDDKWIYFKGGEGIDNILYKVDINGEEIHEIIDLVGKEIITYSVVGESIFYTVNKDSGYGLYKADLNGKNIVRLSVNENLNYVDEVEASQIYYEGLLGLRKELIIEYLGDPIKKESLDFHGYESWDYDNLHLTFYEERLNNIYYSGNEPIFGVNKGMNINKAKDILGDPHYAGNDTEFEDVYTVAYYINNSFGEQLRVEMYTEIGKTEILGVYVSIDIY